MIHAPAGSAPTWPYSLAQLRADHPNVSFPVNPTADDLAPFDVFIEAPTAPPEHNSATHWAREIAPVQVDDEWRQAWELVELPPSPPSPNFIAFNEGLLTENGFKAVWEAVLNINPMLAIAMTTFLETFRTQGDWSQYLESVGRAIGLLETDEQPQYIVGELVSLSQRCHLPAGFIAGLQAIIPPEESE